jgi:hypothetical protein
MKSHSEIEDEVNKTLECFDTFEQIEPNPFFAARVQANIEALERRKAEKKAPVRFGRLRPALVAVMLVLNILSAVTAITVLRTKDTQEETRKRYLAAVIEEYSLNQNEYYLYLSQ